MKNLASIISWCLGQAILALICYILYFLFLEKEFNLELGYLQWLPIIIIFQCVIPKNRSEHKNQNTGKFIPDVNTVKDKFKNGRI